MKSFSIAIILFLATGLVRSQMPKASTVECIKNAYNKMTPKGKVEMMRMVTSTKLVESRPQAPEEVSIEAPGHSSNPISEYNKDHDELKKLTKESDRLRVKETNTIKSLQKSLIGKCKKFKDQSFITKHQEMIVMVKGKARVVRYTTDTVEGKVVRSFHTPRGKILVKETPQGEKVNQLLQSKCTAYSVRPFRRYCAKWATRKGKRSRYCAKWRSVYRKSFCSAWKNTVRRYRVRKFKRTRRLNRHWKRSRKRARYYQRKLRYYARKRNHYRRVYIRSIRKARRVFRIARGKNNLSVGKKLEFYDNDFQKRNKRGAWRLKMGLKSNRRRQKWFIRRTALRWKRVLNRYRWSYHARMRNSYARWMRRYIKASGANSPAFKSARKEWKAKFLAENKKIFKNEKLAWRRHLRALSRNYRRRMFLNRVRQMRARRIARLRYLRKRRRMMKRWRKRHPRLARRRARLARLRRRRRAAFLKRLRKMRARRRARMRRIRRVAYLRRHRKKRKMAKKSHRSGRKLSGAKKNKKRNRRKISKRKRRMMYRRYRAAYFRQVRKSRIYERRRIRSLVRTWRRQSRKGAKLHRRRITALRRRLKKARGKKRRAYYNKINRENRRWRREFSIINRRFRSKRNYIVRKFRKSMMARRRVYYKQIHHRGNRVIHVRHTRRFHRVVRHSRSAYSRQRSWQNRVWARRRNYLMRRWRRSKKGWLRKWRRINLLNSKAFREAEMKFVMNWNLNNQPNGTAVMDLTRTWTKKWRTNSHRLGVWYKKERAKFTSLRKKQIGNLNRLFSNRRKRMERRFKRSNKIRKAEYLKIRKLVKENKYTKRMMLMSYRRSRRSARRSRHLMRIYMSRWVRVRRKLMRARYMSRKWIPKLKFKYIWRKRVRRVCTKRTYSYNKNVNRYRCASRSHRYRKSICVDTNGSGKCTKRGVFYGLKTCVHYIRRRGRFVCNRHRIAYPKYRCTKYVKTRGGRRCGHRMVFKPRTYCMRFTISRGKRICVRRGIFFGGKFNKFVCVKRGKVVKSVLRVGDGSKPVEAVNVGCMAYRKVIKAKYRKYRMNGIRNMYRRRWKRIIRMRRMRRMRKRRAMKKKNKKTKKLDSGRKLWRVKRHASNSSSSISHLDSSIIRIMKKEIKQLPSEDREEVMKCFQ